MSDVTKDLLAGFETYADAEELAEANSAETPATSIPCGFIASYATAKFSC